MCETYWNQIVITEHGFRDLTQKILPGIEVLHVTWRNATLLLHATLLLFKSIFLGGTRSFHKHPYILSKRRTRQFSISPGTRFA